MYVYTYVCVYVCVRARARVCVCHGVCVYICHLSRICATAAHSQERHAAATSTPPLSHAKADLESKRSIREFTNSGSTAERTGRALGLDLVQGNIVLRHKPEPHSHELGVSMLSLAGLLTCLAVLHFIFVGERGAV
jgi:hypothetical protein